MNMVSDNVLINGIGIISHLGLSIDEFWSKINLSYKDDALFSQYTSPQNNTKKYLYGEVRDFSLSNFYYENLVHRLDRASEFATAAAKQALDASSAVLEEYASDKLGVCLGVSNSIATSMSDFDESVLTRGPRRCDIGIFPNAVMCAPASRIAIFEDIKGPNTTVSSGKNSGLDAIGFAFLLLKYEQKKIILSGGTEAFSEKILKWFLCQDMMIEMGLHREAISKRGRFIPTEGSCVFSLSTVDTGAHVYAQVVAFNTSFSFHKKRNVSSRVEVLVKNIHSTLVEAGLSTSSIDAILVSNCYDEFDHAVEVGAVSKIFSKAILKKTPIFNFKKVIGESFSAFGAMQILCAIGLIKNKFHEDVMGHLNINPIASSAKGFDNILVIGVDSSGHNGSIIISSYSK